MDSFRADRARPARHSLISMECVAADNVKDKLTDLTEEYHDLSNRCNLLGDRLADLSGKHRQFNDVAFKLLTWLTDMEGQLSSVKQDAGLSEPQQLQVHLDRLKSLSMDALSQKLLLDEMQKRGQDLTNSLSGQAAEQQQVAKLQSTMNDLSVRYSTLSKDINSHVTQLQAAVTHSQDITQAMNELVSWMDSAEQVVTTQLPISLRRPELNAQLQSFSAVDADVTNHQSALDAVKALANELVKTCELDIARAVEQRLTSLDEKFSSLQAKCRQRDRDLEEVDSSLREFQEKLEQTNLWVHDGILQLDSKELSKLSSDDMKQQLEKLAREKHNRLRTIQEIQVAAEQLLQDPRTGEGEAVKNLVTDLKKNLEAFDSLLAAKENEASDKEQQGADFENAKTIALLWLSQMEARLDEFQPVAIDVGIVEQQKMELQVKCLIYIFFFLKHNCKRPISLCQFF